MIEISVNGTIDAAKVMSTPVDEVEDMLHQHIGTNLSKQLMDRIDDMAFIDMELDEEAEQFNYTAELVLCSKNDIVTNAQIQAQKLAKYGLNEEQIVDVLDTITQQTKGF